MEINGSTSQDKNQEADAVNRGAHRKGIGWEEMVEYYSQWAKAGDYDKDLGPERYRGPEYAAEALAGQVPLEERGSFLVLDVGAGTGFVGLQLQHRGFCRIHALEPAKGMVESAMKKGIYEKLHCMGIGGNRLPIDDDTFDALVCSGAMGEGHIPCTALKEFIRLVRPGGAVVIMMRERYLEEVEEYRDKLEPYMKKFQNAGAWCCLQRQVKPKYSFDNNGVLFIYKVNISGTADIDI